MTDSVAGNRFFRSSRWLSLVGVALIVITIAATAVTIWDLREDAIVDSRREMTNLGVVIAEQTARSLQAVDLVVQEMQQRVLLAGVETPEQFSPRMATAEIYRFLRDRLNNLPQADAVTLIAADGTIVSSSRHWPMPLLNVLEREAYTRLRAHDDPGVFISAPVKSQTTGRWVIQLARRINGPHGELLGIAQAAIELRYFEDFYRAISMDEGGAVTVLRRDGTFLARYPRNEKEIGATMPKESPWYARVAENGGTYRSPGYFSGVVRVVSVHPLRDFPLVVDVTISEDEALAQWRRQSTFIALGALCAVIGFVVLFRLLAVQFRRLERSESSLAVRNADLENSRVRLEITRAEAIQAAEALRESQRMMRVIIDQIPARISVKDKDLRYLLVNLAQADEFGCAPDEAVGKRSEDYKRHDASEASLQPFLAQVTSRDRQVLESAQPSMGVEETLTYDDGRTGYGLSSKAPLFDDKQAVIGVLTVAVDITAQKRADGERLELERQLQHAQKIEALGRLAGGVAHDLNNSLVPVLAMTEIVLDGLPEGSGDRPLLEAVLAGAKRARELVRQILIYSRREEAARHAFDLSDIVSDALTLLRAGIPSTIALVETVAPTLPMTGDPGQLHRVVMNLVMNGAQAIGDQPGTITVAAQGEDDGAHIRLSVTDTGCGMDAGTANRAFEPFFTTKEVGKGTGLGLSIVQGIVLAHGGTIVIDSAPGQGTRFDIVLPTRIAAVAPVLSLAS
jgi:PAS domain S-box-containing protein